MSVAIVITTINEPKNLIDIKKSMSRNDCHIVIATDRKTPNLEADKNVHIIDIPKQISLCKNPIGVPFDCIQRRNMGYLYAIKHISPDFIITIDDDNFIPDNWIIEHIGNLGMHAGENWKTQINIIERILKISCDLHKECFNVVHRGVCFEQISKFNRNAELLLNIPVNIGVNAGMWIGDPDINAYDRILHPNITTSMPNKNDHKKYDVIINPNDWFHPFNSQNTSFIKELFPALFLIPMYPKFYGYKFGRFDDIWQSYICQKIMAHHNLCVRFGSPIVEQKRNTHNVLQDLNEEYPGMIFTSKFLEALDGITLKCESSLENMYEIADSFLLNDDEMLNYVGQKMLWWLTELK